MRNRPPLMSHGREDPTVTDEDISMSSWAYGDPAPFIPKAYVGDPTKFRLVHGGVKETHVFHMHNHQWRLEPDDPKSTIIDSISVSPRSVIRWIFCTGLKQPEQDDRRRHFPLPSLSSFS